jgi:Rps23 Pro-64 3,4-dihydroxylase Tpa1-like proline 4-hydroxylase
MREHSDPFRHWVIEPFADPQLLERVLEEWPAVMQEKDVSTSKKRHLSDYGQMGPYTQDLIGALNSDGFCETLSKLTGIEDLIADPELAGGGLHHIDPGGFLKIHADFNWHPRLKAVRKLNLLLYLNKDWQWNGGLQLCDESLRVVKEIRPSFNRCVVFETTSTSFHGHPDPLNAPVPRKSIALYYYVKADQPERIHSTIYAS